MILMALDHVRDYVGLPGNPTDPARASVALFFTRWITHLCAPVFFFLTGTSAYLAGRGRPVTALSRYLFVRGLFLIALELTVIRCVGYQFNVDYHVTFLVILWALGWAMIALGAVIYLPIPAIAVFGVVLVALHNAFDAVRPSSLGAFGPVWRVLHVQGVLINTPPHLVFVAYPLIPWIGVTAAGYALGPVFEWTPDDRQRLLRRLAAALTATFVVLRVANIYGDPVRWTTQASRVRTLLSFLNATKYPPSLLYLLMTLGPALWLLARFDRRTPPWLQPALTFGRVPLFYFVLHLPAIHALATAACYLRYGEAHWMFESPSLDKYPFTAPPAWGYPLPIVYAIWIGLVVGLYPLCRWYAGVKQRRRDPWLKYL
jgi:uncharacterized membrane protein